MLNTIVNALFGCSHRRTTFPLTPARRASVSQDAAATRTKTYVACLDCGKELDYDWKQMRVAGTARHRAPLTTPETVSLHR